MGEGEGTTGIWGDGGVLIVEGRGVIEDNCTPAPLTSCTLFMRARACIAVTPQSTNSCTDSQRDNTSAVTLFSLNLGITTCSLIDVSHRSNSSSVNFSKGFTKGEGGGIATDTLGPAPILV